MKPNGHYKILNKLPTSKTTIRQAAPYAKSVIFKNFYNHCSLRMLRRKRQIRISLYWRSANSGISGKIAGIEFPPSVNIYFF